MKIILDSSFVISSSLHGIIISEAYGIPARIIRPDDFFADKFWQYEPLFKYEDYYYGTGRSNFTYANNI